MNLLVSNEQNYAAYRNELKAAIAVPGSSPCVPYIGLISSYLLIYHKPPSPLPPSSSVLISHSIHFPLYYTGVFLTDLVFVEDGNLDYKPNTDLINYQKLLFISSILNYLNKCKQQKYNFTQIPKVQSYILNYDCLSDEEQKRRSILLQPPGGR